MRFDALVLRLTVWSPHVQDSLSLATSLSLPVCLLLFSFKQVPTGEVSGEPPSPPGMIYTNTQGAHTWQKYTSTRR